VGRLTFDNPHRYTVAGPNAITLDVTTGNAAIDVAQGSHVISAPVTLADNTIVTLSAIDANLSFTAGLTGSGVILKAGPGIITASRIRTPALLLNGGAVALQSGGGASVLGRLTIAGPPSAPAAKLDLVNNAVILDYTGPSPQPMVRQQILSARGGPGLGGEWTGMGITSSAAAAANAMEPDSRSIGYAENADLPLGPYASFRGQPVDDTSVIMAFTRTGDANLDGVINDDDVTIVGATYAPGVPQSSWAMGDFDYNGFVDDDDVTLLGAFYDPSAAPLGPPVATGDSTRRAEPGAGVGSSSLAAVPEPSTLVLLTTLLVGVGLLWARSRGASGQ
jgi:hypothetical protein